MGFRPRLSPPNDLVAPAVILCAWTGTHAEHRIDPETETAKQRTTGFEAIRSVRAVQRTLFVDQRAEASAAGKMDQLSKCSFRQRVKIPEIASFNQRFIPHKHDAELGVDDAVLVLIADAHHERRLPI